jgi:membrane protease YdiL (CAAX protease family)
MESSPAPRGSFLRAIFISPAEPRLRAGWRLVLQTLLFGIFLMCGFLPLTFIANGIGSSAGLLLTQTVQLIAVTLSVFLARRFLDKRSFVSLGLKLNLQALFDVIAGILITMLMMGLIYGILWAAGWLDFESFAWETDAIGTVVVQVLLAFVIFVMVGWNEELLSRGYHLQTLESGLNTFWAVLLSSAVFGVLHLGNPNSESKWFVATGIFLAGVFLAFGYLRTRQLWLPIGLHIGWNFFEGVVFGFPVSGMGTYRLLHITLSGPELWTGGPFGPEAGLIVIPGLAVGFALVYLYSRKRVASRESGDLGR